jgi:hypothetical protein
MDMRLMLWFGIGAAVLALAGPPALEAIRAPAVAWAQQDSEDEDAGSGVSADEADRDPAAYLTALDMIAAYYHAGRDVYLAGEPESAAAIFAHPIDAIYTELEPIFAKRGIAPFDSQMELASELAATQAPREKVTDAANAVLASLAEAALKAPVPGEKPLSVQARVLGAMIDRAAREYRATAATAPEEETPYLDGYGFYRAAKARADAVLERIAAKDRAAASAAREALDLLARAYAEVQRPDRLPVEPGAVVDQAARAKRALGAVT